MARKLVSITLTFLVVAGAVAIEPTPAEWARLQKASEIGGFTLPDRSLLKEVNGPNGKPSWTFEDAQLQIRLTQQAVILRSPGTVKVPAGFDKPKLTTKGAIEAHAWSLVSRFVDRSEWNLEEFRLPDFDPILANGAQIEVCFTKKIDGYVDNSRSASILIGLSAYDGEISAVSFRELPANFESTTARVTRAEALKKAFDALKADESLHARFEDHLTNIETFGNKIVAHLNYDKPYGGPLTSAAYANQIKGKIPLFWIVTAKDGSFALHVSASNAETDGPLISIKTPPRRDRPLGDSGSETLPNASAPGGRPPLILIAGATTIGGLAAIMLLRKRIRT